MQICALFMGTVNLAADLRSGIHLLGYVVGASVGVTMAVLWFRQWKGIEAISEEKWNRAWFIQPSAKKQL